MDSLILPLSLLIIVFVVMSGYFSFMETALMECRHGRLEKLANDGDEDAKNVLPMVEAPAKFLSVAQVGIAASEILAGFSSIFLARIIYEQISSLMTHRQDQILSVAVALFVVIFLMVLFGEFLPKRAAQQAPEKALLEHYRGFRLVAKIFGPPVSLVSKITDSLMMVLGMNAEAPDVVTEDEVKDLIEQGTEDGTFEKSERAMVDKIFELSDETAYALMTPRLQMVWLDISDGLEQNLKVIRESKQDVFPVGEGSLDECRGVIYAKDVLDAVLDAGDIDLTALIKKPVFVPRTMEIFRIVEKFKATGESVAIVNDEYGGVVGFITLDDIAQEIVGLEAEEEDQFAQKKENAWLVDGLYDIDDFKRRFNLETLPDEDRDHYNTMGGFLTSLFGYIPKAGEVREWENFRFTVEKMDGARIDKILVRKI